MKILFDINVVLDIVGMRHPFYKDSKAAFLKSIELGAKPMLALHTYPTLYYLLGSLDTPAARDAANPHKAPEAARRLLLIYIFP